MTGRLDRDSGQWSPDSFQSPDTKDNQVQGQGTTNTSKVENAETESVISDTAFSILLPERDIATEADFGERVITFASDSSIGDEIDTISQLMFSSEESEVGEREGEDVDMFAAIIETPSEEIEVVVQRKMKVNICKLDSLSEADASVTRSYISNDEPFHVFNADTGNIEKATTGEELNRYREDASNIICKFIRVGDRVQIALDERLVVSNSHVPVAVAAVVKMLREQNIHIENIDVIVVSTDDWESILDAAIVAMLERESKSIEEKHVDNDDEESMYTVEKIGLNKSTVRLKREKDEKKSVIEQELEMVIKKGIARGVKKVAEEERQFRENEKKKDEEAQERLKDIERTEIKKKQKLTEDIKKDVYKTTVQKENAN